MTHLLLRTAQSADAARIAELCGELGYPSQEEETRARLALIETRDDQVVFVAEREGRIAGWIHGFQALRVESAAFGEIGGLVVSEYARGLGVGKALVEAVGQWAKDRGLKSLRVRSNVKREETRRFYLHLGFSASKEQAVFSMPLGT